MSPTKVQLESKQKKLIDAVRQGRIETVRHYLKVGSIDVNWRDKDDRYGGCSALHHACTQDLPQIVELLIHEFKADINLPSLENRLTPLMVAITFGNISSAIRLLQHGANVNIQSKGGWTPLHVACEGCIGYNANYDGYDLDPSAVKFLVETLLAHGADPSIENEDGDSPLCFAKQNENFHAIIDVLTRYQDKTQEGKEMNQKPSEVLKDLKTQVTECISKIVSSSERQKGRFEN